jgi:drug/metabolite transporter (DMT)-like permease
MQNSRDAKTYAAFLGAIFIGGTNFIAVTFSNRELPPLFGAALRFALAAAIFFVITRIRGLPPVRGRALAGAALYGVFGFGISYAGLYYALVGLTAGTVSVVMAAAPLVTLLMAVAVGQERLTVQGVLGGLLTVAGIGILSIGAFGGDLNLTYLLGALVGVVAASASSVVARNYRNLHPATMNAIGMAAGAALLATGSVVIGEAWSLPGERVTWLALGWLILLGSVSLFQLFLYIVNRWTASAATFAISAMPVIAAGLGALVLDQPITIELVVGGLMVVIAVYVGAILGAGQKSDETAAAGAMSSELQAVGENAEPQS